MKAANLTLVLLLAIAVLPGSSISTEYVPPPSIAQQYRYLIFPAGCFESLVENMNLTDIACVKLTVSKLMGYGLVAGAAIVKIPQVVRIVQEKSVYGISFTSVLMEALTNWIAIVYSWYRWNPFSIYGENVFLLVQNLGIMALFITFGRNVPEGVADPGSFSTKKNFAIYVVFMVLMYVTENPHSWPPALIDSSILLQIALFSSARLIQIIHIFRCKSTGSLALVTCLLVLAGNIGRVFTVVVEIGEDYLFAVSVILAAVLNAVIVAQFFIFRKSKASTKEKSS